MEKPQPFSMIWGMGWGWGDFPFPLSSTLLEKEDYPGTSQKGGEVRCAGQWERRSRPQAYVCKVIQGDELRDGVGWGGATGVQAMLERENLRVHPYWGGEVSS